MVITLLQGITGSTQTIAQAGVTPTNVFTEVVLTLNQAQIDSIVFSEDGRAYNLQVQVSTFGPIQTDCCELPINAVLFISYEGSCANGLTFPLIYDPNYGEWRGYLNTTQCVNHGTFQSEGTGQSWGCDDGSWSLGAYGPGYEFASPSSMTFSCVPFLAIIEGTYSYDGKPVTVIISEVAP